MRINKFLAESGLASRRGSENFIREGRVRVNGKVVTDLSVQVCADDIVEVDGQIISATEEKVYIILNKPKNCVTTCRDQFGRRTVLDVLGDVGLRVFPVGRLDWETEGLLILTNDGEFARRITHPSSQVPKTYVAVLSDSVRADQLKKLGNGVEIDGKKTARAKVRLLDVNKVEIIITEGRNRQVRKMFEAVGSQVKTLKRVAIGQLTLGNLKTGEWKKIKKPTALFDKNSG